MSDYCNSEELEKGFQEALKAPQVEGRVEALVTRPGTGLRKLHQELRLSLAGGAEGDAWAKGCWKKLEDGSPHPDVQIALTNSRWMRVAARGEERWALAGDNLFVDLDLSEGNLKSGDRLEVGEAVLEVTAIPHNGCKKYSDRFGPDALKFVNSDPGKRHHLRGIYARVVRDGMVRLGDVIRKV